VNRLDRALAGVGALCGILGVALSALAAHSPAAAQLDTAARFLLVHAPALMAIAALANGHVLRSGLARVGGLLLAMGLALFCGDLTRRALEGVRLAPYAAPVGGFTLMAGWFLCLLAAIVPQRR
jgi:uncharacterized membrane protein YgdD (TMEM256/DUF423 family)